MLKVVQIIPDERDVRGLEAEVPSFGSAPTALLEGFALFPDEVEIHVVSCLRRELPTPEKLSNNIFYHAVHVHGGYRRSLFAEAVSKVRKTIREINPDVVHGQGTEDYPGICAAFSGVPNCITIHGNMRAVARTLNYRPFPAMTVTALAESIALRKTDAVICNSSYTDRCVGKLNKNKIRIPNAVRSSFFELATHRARHNSQLTVHGSPTLLCIGDILPYKNQIGLMHALDAFPDIGPETKSSRRIRQLAGANATATEQSAVANSFGTPKRSEAAKIRLVFAGSCSPDSSYGTAFLKEVFERPWCEYAGRLTLSELQEKLIDCAGMIHPTREESFGLAVAEAQSAGVPVAASAVGGIPDLIRNEKTGWLFDPDSVEDLCKKAGRLLDLPAGRECAVRAADVAQNYRPESVAAAHIEFYRKMRAGDTE